MLISQWIHLGDKHNFYPQTRPSERVRSFHHCSWKGGIMESGKLSPLTKMYSVLQTHTCLILSSDKCVYKMPTKQSRCSLPETSKELWGVMSTCSQCFDVRASRFKLVFNRGLALKTFRDEIFERYLPCLHSALQMTKKRVKWYKSKTRDMSSQSSVVNWFILELVTTHYLLCTFLKTLLIRRTWKCVENVNKL